MFSPITPYVHCRAHSTFRSIRQDPISRHCGVKTRLVAELESMLDDIDMLADEVELALDEKLPDIDLFKHSLDMSAESFERFVASVAKVERLPALRHALNLRFQERNDCHCERAEEAPERDGGLGKVQEIWRPFV